MINFGISAEEFLKNYYEKQFGVFRGSLTSNRISWTDINSALFAWDPSDGRLQLFKDGLVPAENYTEPFVDLGMPRTKIVKDVFYQQLRAGATLILNRLETKSEPIHDLTMEIARFVGEKAVANGYAAFGGKGTFAKHWDTHDVFAVQLIGRKHWRVFKPTFPHPLPHQKSKEYKHECPENPVFDDVLEQGDILYVPRGWWHEATPIPEKETFHIAVGIHPILLRDYFAWACLTTLPENVELRQALKAESTCTPGFSGKILLAGNTFANEDLLIHFKKQIIANERVVSRFAIEELGQKTKLPDPIRHFNINSSYRTPLVKGEKLHVNGCSIETDDVSQIEMKGLFIQERSNAIDIQDYSAPQEKVEQILQKLFLHDVISRKPE